MQLPRWMVKIVDPVTGYMDDRRPTGPMFRGGAVYGPGVPGGARQATAEELEEMRIQAEASHHAPQPRGDPTDANITTAAKQLIDTRVAVMQSAGREVHAKIVTFWHGDSLLEISVQGADRQSSSTVRIPRHLTEQHQALLATYLADALHIDG